MHYNIVHFDVKKIIFTPKKKQSCVYIINEIEKYVNMFVIYLD